MLTLIVENKAHSTLAHFGGKFVRGLAQDAPSYSEVGDPGKPGAVHKPKHRVLIHSDQGSQFTSMGWAAFIRAHNLEHSMSRRGNCHDNAVAESFFSSFKRERIRRRTCKTREEARQDVFDYVEMFYNPKGKHVSNGMLPPGEFERQKNLKANGVQKTRIRTY